MCSYLTRVCFLLVFGEKVFLKKICCVSICCFVHEPQGILAAFFQCFVQGATKDFAVSLAIPGEGGRFRTREKCRFKTRAKGRSETRS